MANQSRTVEQLKVLLARKTGIADNTATSVIRVFVPNGTVCGSVHVKLLGINGSTDAFESARTAVGTVVFTRTSDAATVATAVTLAQADIATVSGGATHTLAYGVSSISGDNDKAQYFDIQVTINDSGNLGSNVLIYEASLLSSEPGMPGGPYMVSL